MKGHRGVMAAASVITVHHCSVFCITHQRGNATSCSIYNLLPRFSVFFPSFHPQPLPGGLPLRRSHDVLHVQTRQTSDNSQLTKVLPLNRVQPNTKLLTFCILYWTRFPSVPAIILGRTPLYKPENPSTFFMWATVGIIRSIIKYKPSKLVQICFK